MNITICGMNLPAYRGVQGEEDIKELVEEVSVHFIIEGSVDLDGVYIARIKSGYQFDGASIPRFLWRLCGHPFQSPRDAAALLHDWLYSSKWFTRDIADTIYREAQVFMGISKWKAWVEYAALRVFGDAAWNGNGNDKMLNAEKYGSIKWSE